MNRVVKQALVSVAIAAALTPAAWSQVQRPGGAPAATQGRAFSLPSERIEARLAYVKTALKISDAQNAQWNAYADVLRKHAKEADQRFQSRRGAQPGAQPQRPNAIERLERRQAFAASMVVRLNELLAVQKPLYAALSAEQKSVADRLLAPGGGRGMGGQRGERGMGGMGGQRGGRMQHRHGPGPR